MTSPEDKNDHGESLKCYESLADEVVVVGDWPLESTGVYLTKYTKMV